MRRAPRGRQELGLAENEVDAALGRQPGATLTAPQLHDLARVWWSTRLDPGGRPRNAAESQEILSELGLTGAFWRLA